MGISFPKTMNGVFFSTNGNGQTTPNLINQLYNVDNNVNTNSGSSQSVFESLGQSYSEDDLADFQKRFGFPREKIAKVIGPNSPSQCSFNPNNCAEASLDVQYMMGIAQNASTVYWSLPGDSEPFL